MKTYIRNLLLLVVLGAAARSIHAASIVWTNTAGGNWSVAANWNPNQTPGSSDTAVITNNGNYTIVMDIETTVGGLVLGKTNNGNNPTLLISNNTFTLAGFLTNYGTVVWSNANLYGQSSPQIYNYGLWDAKANNTFYGGNSGGATIFNNFGTFRKSAGASISKLDNHVTFYNSGTVDVQIGGLEIQHGCGSGVFNVASSATLGFDALGIDAYVLTGDPTFTGTGFAGGKLTGSNAVVHGTLKSDSLTLSGSLTFASDAVVSLVGRSGAGNITFDTTFLTNYGTVVWSNANLYGQSGPQIDNRGLWDAQTDNTFSGSGSGYTTLFNNFGTFRKSGTGSSISELDTHVTFNNSGTVDVQIGGLTIQSGSGGGVFNVASAAVLGLDHYGLTGDPTFTGTGFTRGYVTGSNAVIHGTLKSDSLTLSGSLTFASDAVVSLVGRSGAGNITFDTTFLTNYGTVVWSNANLYGQSGPQIDNRGLWDAQTDNTFSGSGSSGTTFFNNFGTFRKSGTSGAISKLDSHVTFNNSGTVEVQIGGLTIQSGSGGGVFNVASAAVLGFDPYGLTGDPAFTGSGFCWGHLTGSNAVIHGTLKSDSLTFSGSLTFASNSVVSLAGRYGAGNITFDTTFLTNYGTVVWSNANLYGQSGPQIDNRGLWDAQTDNTFSGSGSSGTTFFNNFGTFRKSGTSGAISKLDSHVTFNNSGTVEVQIGGLTIQCGSGGGVFNVASAAVLGFDPYGLTGDPAFTGSGFCWGHLTGSNAVIHGTLKSDSLTFSGSLIIASNAVVTLTGRHGFGNITFDTTVLTNYGAVVCSNVNLYGQYSPQINNCGLWNDTTDNTFGGSSSGTTLFNNFGIFRKSGTSGANSKLDNNVTFNNAGTVDVQIGGLTIGGSYTLAGGTVNFGINSSNNFGSIHLVGDAALTGTVSANLNNNYAPVAGASFPVLAYGSESGIFTTLKLPAGFAWQTNYGATTFTLSISAVLPAQLSVARCGNNTISFAWNGVRGQSYQVQYTTNLVSLDWINLGDLLPVTNGTMTASDTIHSDPQRFYRVVLIQ